jgi:hypothetical protein
MLENERKKLNDFNRELMVANTEYEELKKKIFRLGKLIYRRKKKIEELLDRKDSK